MSPSEHTSDVQDDAEAEHAEGSGGASAASLQVHSEHLQDLAPAVQLSQAGDAAEDAQPPEPSFGKVQPLAAEEDAHVLELSSSKPPLLRFNTLLTLSTMATALMHKESFSLSACLLSCTRTVCAVPAGHCQVAGRRGAGQRCGVPC